VAANQRGHSSAWYERNSASSARSAGAHDSRTDLQLLIWQQSHSERLGLAARDLHLLPVELSHDEAVEALVVGAAVVTQEPERLLLADEEAEDAVGAVVDAAASRPSAMLAASLSISLPRVRPAPRQGSSAAPSAVASTAAAVAPAVVAVKSAGPRRLVKSGHLPQGRPDYAASAGAEALQERSGVDPVTEGGGRTGYGSVAK